MPLLACTLGVAIIKGTGAAGASVAACAGGLAGSGGLIAPNGVSLLHGGAAGVSWDLGTS